MPRLVDLEAAFLCHEVRIETKRYVKADVFSARPNGPFADEAFEDREGPCTYIPEVDTLTEAHGVWFLCPKCFVANGNSAVGTHRVICWFVGKVPDDLDPKPGRWTSTGTGLDDLTLVPSEGRTQSVLLTAGCQWHGVVVNGKAE